MRDIEVQVRPLPGRTSFTEMITGIKGGGGLEKYLGVEPLKPFISLEEVLERMVPFRHLSDAGPHQ
jgi:hypothetical protein